MLNQTQYDVFLCHNSKEKETVIQIRSQLQQQGIHGWLDKYDFEPMRPWQEQLEAIIPRIKAVAIFLGASGVGPWANFEMREFLVEFAQRDLRMGLVLLPGCPANLDNLEPPVPRFLKSFHWIDFRLSDPDPMEQLIWGITGQKKQAFNPLPTPPFEPQASVTLTAPINPADRLTATDWFDRGLYKRKQGNIPGAIEDYTQAIRLNPSFANAYYNRGNARSGAGDLRGAIEDYNHAIQLMPHSAAAYTGRGNAHKALGDPDRAIADYTQAIQLKPTHAAAYSNRASARKALGDIQGAIQDCDRVLQLQPDYAPAWYNRACYFSLQGNVQNATQDLRQAIQLDANYRKHAVTDSDFHPIRADQQFQQLLQ